VPVTAQAATTIIKYGDINDDGKVDLADAILCLQVLCGVDPGPTINLGACINNQKVTLEDVIYILQHISGMR